MIQVTDVMFIEIFKNSSKEITSLEKRWILINSAMFKHMWHPSHFFHLFIFLLNQLPPSLLTYTLLNPCVFYFYPFYRILSHFACLIRKKFVAKFVRNEKKLHIWKFRRAEARVDKWKKGLKEEDEKKLLLSHTFAYISISKFCREIWQLSCLRNSVWVTFSRKELFPWVEHCQIKGLQRNFTVDGSVFGSSLLSTTLMENSK